MGHGVWGMGLGEQLPPMPHAPCPMPPWPRVQNSRRTDLAVLSDTRSHPGLSFTPRTRTHQRVTGSRTTETLSRPNPGQGCASITLFCTRTKQVPAARDCRNSTVDDAASGMEISASLGL